MEMTFEQYTVNPMGIKNAVFSNREMYRQLYTSKLDKILVREAGKIEYKLYTDNDDYYIHIRVPSEVIEKFYYDVVIQFYTKDNKDSKSLSNYNVRFYSNDPSFVFTFAHAFITNKLFIPDLQSKMSKQAIEKRAVEKNPKNEVGYVKSLYFTYLICKSKGLFNKIKFQSEGTTYSKNKLLKDIIHADIKVEERIKAGEALTKKHKVEKAKENNNSSSDNRNTIQKNMTNLSNKIRSTSIIGRSNTSKKTSRTKKI